MVAIKWGKVWKSLILKLSFGLCSPSTTSHFSFLKFSFFSIFFWAVRPLLNSGPYSTLCNRTQAQAKSLCFLSLYCFTPITETTQNISNSCHSERNLRVNRLSLFLLFVPLCCFFPSSFDWNGSWVDTGTAGDAIRMFLSFLSTFPFFLLSHIGHMKLQTLLWIWRWRCFLLKYSS